MKIAVAGEEKRLIEFRSIVSELHHVFETENFQSPFDFSTFDLIVDLNADDRNEISDEIFLAGKNVLLCAVKKTLKQLTIEKKLSSVVAGFNALPTFLSRPIQEISFLKEEEAEHWKNIFELLKWETGFVKDRAGMVTPRILFMVINEACFTLEEGTASKEDIDSGMKMGTAYPMGPLEWADKIGLKNIYETLLAIQFASIENRYKICSLLQTMCYSQQPFFFNR